MVQKRGAERKGEKEGKLTHHTSPQNAKLSVTELMQHIAGVIWTGFASFAKKREKSWSPDLPTVENLGFSQWILSYDKGLIFSDICKHSCLLGWKRIQGLSFIGLISLFHPLIVSAIIRVCHLLEAVTNMYYLHYSGAALYCFVLMGYKPWLPTT